MRHIDHDYIMLCLEPKPDRNEIVSISCIAVYSPGLMRSGYSTDTMLDNLIVYTINRGAMTRCIINNFIFLKLIKLIDRQLSL